MASRVAIWVGSAFVASLAAAAGAVLHAGANEKGADLGLLLTARVAFLLFWPAYAGGALASLFGRIFEPVRRSGRELGLAFAAAMSVHFALIAWLCLIDHAPGLPVFLVFGTGVVWIALLVAFSVGGIRRWAGPASWWIVRVAGMNYVLYAFAIDFHQHPAGGGLAHRLFYLPFWVLCLAAPVLRVAAFVQSKVARRPAGSPSTAPSRITT